MKSIFVHILLAEPNRNLAIANSSRVSCARKTFAFYINNYGRIFSHFGDMQRQRMI